MGNSDRIPEDIKRYVDYVIKIVDGSTNDWFRIRRTLINCLPNDYRVMFARRHNSVRKIVMNQADYDIMDYWEKQTGNRLLINKTKMTPIGYVSVSRSENMRRINELRKIERAKRNEDEQQE